MLAGTPLATDPLQSTTLADVLADPTASVRFASVPLSGLDVSATALASLPLASVALAGTPLRSIPLPGSDGTTAGNLTAWCAELTGLGFSCPTDFGIDPADPSTAENIDLLALALAGVPIDSVPLRSIPLTSIDLTSSPLASLPLRSITLANTSLGSIPLRSIPLRSIPLGSIPLRSIGDLSSVVDCTVPGIDCSAGSTETLADAAADGALLSTATLAQLETLDSSALGAFSLSTLLSIASSPLRSIPLRSIDIASSPLRSIPLRSIDIASSALGSIPLRSIGDLSSVVDCTMAGIDCSAGSTETLADAAAAGALLSTATLAQLQTLDSVALSAVPLRSIDLAGSALGALPLRSIGTLSSVVDCTVPGVDCSATSTQTLADAAAAGAIASTATLNDLGPFLGTTLGSLGFYGTTTLADLGTFLGTTVGQLLADLDAAVPGFPTLTLSDLLAGLTPPTSYPWQSVDLTSLPLARYESSGGSDTLSTSLDVSSASAVTVTVTLTLPSGFAYVAGSATLDGSHLGDPSSTTSPLVFAPVLTPGTHTLSVQVTAGTGLGPATAGVSAEVDSDAPSTSSTTMTVTDGLAPNYKAAATAAPLPADTLNFGYISSATDVDYWSLPVNQGEEVALALSNLPADYDLTLFAPNGQQLQGTPVQQAPGVTDSPPSLTSVDQPTPGGNDVPVTAPPGYQLYAVSDNRGTTDETIQTTPLDAGTYLVQVSGYNGASSPEPYLLRATTVASGTVTSCPAITYPNPTPAPAASPPVPAGANTLFLVDTGRLTAEYGSAAEGEVMTALSTVAGDGADGVNAAVVPVDGDPAVAAAYRSWNDGPGANPCSVAAANGVVSAIATLVDTLRSAHPTITNVVIVGADDQIPFARIADGATQSNERDYAPSTFPGESNVLANTLAQGYYLSDDPYTANQPLAVGSATLYTPEVAVGRLVETPAQIVGALNRFVSSHGVLDASAALSTGYSFLTSGAQLVAANLSKVSGRSVAQLINETWTHTDLDNALTTTPAPGLDSINAHFDFSRALPAIGNTTGDQSDLFTTTDIRSAPTSTYAGRLLFSMGCHAGLDVDDAEVAASGITTPVDDWAKAFADSGALWVANTGYGYGDTDTVAYSARLMADFAANLDGSVTVGTALTEAKQTYAAADAVLSAYDLKAMMESTFYGLPMYHLNSTPPVSAAAPQPPATQTDPITGLPSASIHLDLPLGSGAGDLGRQSGGTGQYYEVNGSNPYNGQTQTTEYRPIEPLATVDVTQPSSTSPGSLAHVAHGALITGLTSTDVGGFTPTVAEPDVDSSSNGASAGAGVDPFPAQLQRVATYQDVGAGGVTQHQQFDFVAGQFEPDASGDGQGTQRLFTSVDASVLYDDPSDTDFAPATIGSTDAYVSGANADFVVDASDPEASIKRVLVLYTDAETPGTWTALDLASSDGQHWSGSGSATASGKIAYFVQVVDAAGNVAVSSNKGGYFPALAAPVPSGPVTIGLTGSPVVDGYATGPVTADISGPQGTAGLTYSLDGASGQPVPVDGQVLVTGDGAHEITVTDETGDTDSQLIRIDATAPVISTSFSPAPVGTPPGLLPPGAELTVAVTDAGSGVGSVTYKVNAGSAVALGGASGSIPLTSSATVVITALDKVGNEATSTVVAAIDDQAPDVSCAVPPVAWTDQDVSVPCTASDAQSGLADSAQATFTLSTAVTAGTATTSAETPSTTVCDNVGNCAAVGPFGPFEVDKSAPIVSAATSVTPSASGYVKVGTSLNVAAGDIGSGITSVTYRATGAQSGTGTLFTATGTDPLTVAASLPLTAPGTTTFVLNATDQAGNSSPPVTITVEVDGAAPTVTCTVPPVGWTNQDVSVPCTAVDTQSGLADPLQASFALSTSVANGTDSTVAMTATSAVCDNVGNCAAVGPFGPFEVDKKAPTVSATTSPTPSPSGWVPGSGSVVLSATDTGSGVKAITYALTGAQTGGGTVAGHSVTVPLTSSGTITVQYSATDNVGNASTTGTLVVRADTAAPLVHCSPPTQKGWSATDVSVPCTAVDSQSGLSAASPTPQSSWSFSLSTNVAPGSDAASASTGTFKVCDEVGNCTTAGPYGPYKVDKKAPSITVTSPAAGASYYVGQVVKAAYSCSDSGAGLASCSGSVANGAAVPTGAVGPYTLTVTAKDAVGNTVTQSVSYSVANRLCAVTTPAPKPATAVVFTVQLCDGTGHNLTTVKTVLTAARVDAATVPVSALPDPKNTFFFVPVVDDDVYTLQDAKLAVGPHILYVTVAGDPTLHPVPFTVSR